MGFTKIDFDTWKRKEYFDFFKDSPIYMTVEMDVTQLFDKAKAAGFRLYPALVYCAAKVINSDPAFRYGRNEQGCIGLWDRLHPYYTVPRLDDGELFSMKCTEFTEDFAAFYKAFTADYETAQSCGRLLCDKALPPDICGISIVAGISYQAFSFGGMKEDFTPFVMFGKITERNGRRMMPVTGEFSHAVNDGIHIERFFNELEKNMRTLL